MGDIWSIAVQAFLTAGATWFITHRLDRARTKHSKELQRIGTDQVQYLEGIRSDNALALERFKSEQAQYLEEFRTEQAKGIEGVKAQLLVLTRLQAGVEEKRAEVAANVLISALQYLDGLEFVTNSLHVGGGANGEKTTFAEWVDARWQAIHGLEVEFSKSRASADTFLGDDVAEFLKRIWDQRREIWANQSTHLAVVKQTPHDREFWRKGFGSEPAEALAKLRIEARALLRPIIQHEKALGDRPSPT